MNCPDELSYSKTHEWVEYIEDSVRVGITDYAQESMGELVFVNLPEPGDRVVAGEAFGDVESVKAVSELYSPFSGTVTAVNQELLDDPGFINRDPYTAWLIEVSDITETEDLLDAAGYVACCEAEEE